MISPTPLNFSGNLDYWVQADECRQYQTFPLTVEVDLRLDSIESENMILADGYPLVTAYKLVGNHWRLFTQAETGYLSVFLSNMSPTEIHSQQNICDSAWHRIAMTLNWNRVSLYIDGAKVCEEEITPIVKTYDLGVYTGEGPLFFGGFPPFALTCQGALDTVRISCLERSNFESNAPLIADHATVGLWRLVEGGEIFEDHSLTHNPASKISYLPSLDDNDRRAFGVSTDPFDRSLQTITFDANSASAGEPPKTLGVAVFDLDGVWSLARGPNHGLSEVDMLEGSQKWQGSIAAQVPGTVQTAMFEAGLIEDPLINRQNLNMDWLVNREWWYRRAFQLSEDWSEGEVELVFDGVDYEADFWLNGVHLGQHKGMFGGPEFDVTRWLRTEGSDNELVVRIYPAPVHIEDNFKNNVAYGWHYVRLVTLGIWRSVRLVQRKQVKMDTPFMKVGSLSGADADVALSVDCYSGDSISAELEITLKPVNFKGKGFAASLGLDLKAGWNRLGFKGLLEDVHLWWPNGLGDPDFYELNVRLSSQGNLLDSYCGHWGAKMVETHPIPQGPRPYLYNSQLSVNGCKIWQKGANWCYVDPLLRLNKQRMERFVRMARDAHVQILRVWGGGPVENDVFYDLCDRYGILVQQEFSILGFHKLQDIPGSLAVDITEHMVKRLRNRPSLGIWNCANEISGQGRIVETLGRRCLELDGSRPFRRSCPYGGDVHWYGVYWEGRPILDYRKAADGRLETWSPDRAPQLIGAPSAFTEFGLSSPPNLETWERIIPQEELADWPPKADAVFLHHTPTYSDVHVDLMTKYASRFMDPRDLKTLIQGMQLSQGMGLKLLVESMRARKPDTVGTMIYKWTDNYPACAWSVIDYYGVPKRAYNDVRDAYAPVHVMALFDAWNSGEDGRLNLSYYGVNDSREPLKGKCQAVWLDGSLKKIREAHFDVTLVNDRAFKFADVAIDLSGRPDPVFLVMSLFDDSGILLDRNAYPFNFVERQGCLFRCPPAVLSVQRKEEVLSIQNTGDCMALSVSVDPGRASNTFYLSKNHLWLFPGETIETRLIYTKAVDGQDRALKHLVVRGWNVEPVEIGNGT